MCEHKAEEKRWKMNLEITQTQTAQSSDKLSTPYHGNNWGLENIFTLTLLEIEQHKSKQYRLAMNKFKLINRRLLMIKGQRFKVEKK